MADSPEVSLDPHTALARRQVQLYQRCHRWISSLPVFAQGELTVGQFGAFAELRSGRLTSGALAERLKVTPAVVTGLVDRLERSGFVERVPAVDDRRRTHLHITPRGERALDEADDAVCEPISQVLATLGEREVAILNWSFDHLERVLSRPEEQSPTASDRARDG